VCAGWIREQVSLGGIKMPIQLLDKVSTNNRLFVKKAAEVLQIRGFLRGTIISGRVLGEYREFTAKLKRADLWHQLKGKQPGQILIGLNYTLSGYPSSDEAIDEDSAAVELANQKILSGIARIVPNVASIIQVPGGLKTEVFEVKVSRSSSKMYQVSLSAPESDEERDTEVKTKTYDRLLLVDL
jgi:hypothetical protein